MSSYRDYSTPRKFSYHPEPTSPIFDEPPGLSAGNISLIEPIGQPHNHPTTIQRERKKKLNVHSSKFLKNFTPSPFALGESNNTTFDTTDVTHTSIVTEPVAQNPNLLPNIEHLDLGNFKLKPCPLVNQHNHKHCPYYHNSKDHKRPGNFFSSEMCEHSDNPDNCPRGENCNKAHNRVEQLYKPEKYKTKFCAHYPLNLHLCDYGNFCSFAHSEADINIELIHNYEYDDDFYMFHFKTAWCPFNLTQHDKALCVYAHNWQDYRRKPQIAHYDPFPCSNWKSTDFILNYEDGCHFKEKCTKCHGWKELEYHPFNYKTKHCPSKNCVKGRDCPHFHSNRERRVISANVVNKAFRIVPRNRVIAGTYKVRKIDQSIANLFNSIQSAKKALPAFLDPPLGSGPEDPSAANHNLLSTFGDIFQNEDHAQFMSSILQELAGFHNMNEKVRKSRYEPMFEHDSKRRNSLDSPCFEEVKQTRKSTDGTFSCHFPESDLKVTVSKRKWSTNEGESNTSSYQTKEQILQNILHSQPRRVDQIHAKDLEDDIDSIESASNLDEEDDIDAELRQNLERIIDNDDI